MKKYLKIAFIGCGNLSTSLLRGLLASGYPKEKIRVTNRSATKNQKLRASLGVDAREDNHQAVAEAEVIILGVKPQQMQLLGKDIALLVQQKQPLIISVATGISTTMLARWLGTQDVALVRSMPNIATIVAAGASGLYANEYVTAAQKDFAESLHRAVGLVVWVEKESLIEVVAAVSGSGPAYFFYIIEAMQATAIKLGLSDKVARELVLQTALGASRLALESENDIATLRKKVTSPQGITEQAMKVFDERQLAVIIETAMRAARVRAQALTVSLEKEM